MKASRFAIFIVVIVLLVCGVASLFFPKLLGGLTANRSEEGQYATETLEAIAKPWSFPELWTRGDSEFRHSGTKKEVKLMTESSRDEFGDLESISDIQTTKQRVEKSKTVPAVVYNLHINANFKQGKAAIDMVVVKKGEVWAVREFLISPRSAEDSGKP